jgi:hypothetical protein
LLSLNGCDTLSLILKEEHTLRTFEKGVKAKVIFVQAVEALRVAGD